VTKINKAWLDSHEWMLRSSNNGISYGGYKWKRKGEWNKAPDWNDRAECGGGFHGNAPEAHGYGFDYKCIELHETRGKRIIIDDKIKVPESRIVAVDSEIPVAAFKRCKINILAGDRAKIRDNQWYVLGNGKIEKITGGMVQLYGKSTVKIGKVIDGCMYFHSKSKAVIREVTGGHMYFCDNSEITIKNASGASDILSYDKSKTMIENVNGGCVESHDEGKITIKNVDSGGVWSYENSKITIENMTGGHIHSYGEYSIEVINDLRNGATE